MVSVSEVVVVEEGFVVVVVPGADGEVGKVADVPVVVGSVLIPALEWSPLQNCGILVDL